MTAWLLAAAGWAFAWYFAGEGDRLAAELRRRWITDRDLWGRR